MYAWLVDLLFEMSIIGKTSLICLYGLLLDSATARDYCGSCWKCRATRWLALTGLALLLLAFLGWFFVVVVLALVVALAVLNKGIVGEKAKPLIDWVKSYVR